MGLETALGGDPAAQTPAGRTGLAAWRRLAAASQTRLLGEAEGKALLAGPGSPVPGRCPAPTLAGAGTRVGSCARPMP